MEKITNLNGSHMLGHLTGKLRFKKRDCDAQRYAQFSVPVYLHKFKNRGWRNTKVGTFCFLFSLRREWRADSKIHTSFEAPHARSSIRGPALPRPQNPGPKPKQTETSANVAHNNFVLN